MPEVRTCRTVWTGVGSGGVAVDLCVCTVLTTLGTHTCIFSAYCRKGINDDSSGRILTAFPAQEMGSDSIQNHVSGTNKAFLGYKIYLYILVGLFDFKSFPIMKHALEID